MKDDSAKEIVGAKYGVLDGLTIVRFCRAYGGGAGLEYDVEIMNRALCDRNSLHIIQIHMARPGDSLEPLEQTVGRGKVTKIPLTRDVLPVSLESRTPSVTKRFKRWIKLFVRDHILFSRLFSAFTYSLFGSKEPTHKLGDVEGVGKKLREVLKDNPASLLMIHAGGGKDTWEAIQEAGKAGIPCAMQLHFSNTKYKDFSVRIQAANVQGVTGVSNVNVPDYLKDRYVSMFTAVDSDYFSRVQAGEVDQTFKHPVIVLPARIVPTKGHDDLVTSIIGLKNAGKRVDVVLAGRADQPEYEIQLKARIHEAGLDSWFHFLGLLNQEQVRDLYGVSSLLVFPTFHEEGCPRILIEASSMQVPVIVYDSGGSRAGLVDGETGILVDVGDVSNLTKAMLNLLDNPDLARKMGDAGREFVMDQFSSRALAERHENFYMGLIENYPGATRLN